MSLFAKILSQFNRIKFNEKTQFSEYEANRAMDQLVQLNAGYSQFDRDIAEQLWQHSTKNPEGKVLLKDYIQTIIDARNILKENIDKCSKQLIYEQDPAKRQQLKECLLSYGQDHRIIGEPLNLEQQPSKNASMYKSKSSEHNQLSSQIFTGTTSTRQVSTTLKIVLITVLALLVCQILCMFVRHHFMNFLTYVAIVAIFTQNYFDRLYMLFCEVALGISLILDIFWVIIHSGNYWNPSKETQYSHLQPALLKLALILTIIGMVGKVLIGIILFRFVKNTQSTVKVVYFFDKKIELSGRVENNPISALLAPRNT